MGKSIGLTGAAIALACCGGIQAQIITDGSVGQQLTLNATDVEIGESLGTRSGNNLFHSFQVFNISSGGSATFTGAADINHVISRVTGGEVSVIQGLLRSEVGNADFYFVNPAGVTFSDGGAVDVPASFHLSTADELRFSDDELLVLNRPQSSVLSMGVPQQFGFLNGDSGSIQVIGSDIFIGSSRDSTEAMTLSASTLAFDRAGIQTPGDLLIAAVADAAVQVDLDTGVQTTATGNITVTDTMIGPGPLSLPDNVRVQAGDLTVVEEAALSGLVAESNGLLSVVASNLDLSRGLLASSGGVDLVVANQLSIRDGGIISSSNSNEVRLGNSSERSLGRYADILEQESNVGSGDVRVVAGELLIDGDLGAFTGITTHLGLNAPGNAGNIEVVVNGKATLQNYGQVTSVTESGGTAGNISFTAGQLLLEHTDVSNGAGIFSETYSVGDAGNVEIFIANDASISGRISSSTESAGDAGDIRFNANSLLLRQFSEFSTGIFSDSNGAGRAGNIEVNIEEDANLVIGGRITSNAAGEGDGGVIRLTAGQLLIDGARDVTTGIFSRAFDFSDNNGDAGDIEVTVFGTATLQNGGRISTSTVGSGDAGTVKLTANQIVIRHDGGEDELLDPTGIFGESEVFRFRDPIEIPTGNAGSIEVTVGDAVYLQNGGQISSNNEGSGEGGSVTIKSDSGTLLITDGSEVSSSALEFGSNSGFIEIDTGGMLIIENATVSTQSQGGLARPITISANILNTRGGQITTSTNSATADGGNISLQTEVYILRESIVQANADSGSGGEITVDSAALVPFASQLNTDTVQRINLDDPSTVLSGNVIQAVAENGVTIPPTLNTPELDVSAALAGIDTNLRESQAVAADPCAGAQAGGSSTLISASRGALPIDSEQTIQILDLPVSDIGASEKLYQRMALLVERADTSGKLPCE